MMRAGTDVRTPPSIFILTGPAFVILSERSEWRDLPSGRDDRVTTLGRDDRLTASSR